MNAVAIEALAMGIRTLVALVFLTAAIGKMRHWAQFQGVIANYRLLPDVLIAPVTYILPPVEAVLGSALLLNLAYPWPDVAAMGLLVLFATAMGINVLRGRRDIDCGCFQSALKQRLSWIFVLRNAVLALLTGLTLFSAGPLPDSWMRIDALLLGGVLFVLLQTLNILWSLVPSWRRPLAAGS